MNKKKTVEFSTGYVRIQICIELILSNLQSNFKKM